MNYVLTRSRNNRDNILSFAVPIKIHLIFLFVKLELIRFQNILIDSYSSCDFLEFISWVLLIVIYIILEN